MSFSGDIKDEIARRLPDDYHCLLAEIAAIIHYAGAISGTAEEGAITIETENVVLAKKYLRLIKKTFDIGVDLDIRKQPAGKSNLYKIVLSGGLGDNPVENQDEECDEFDMGDKFSRVWMETADWEQPGFKESLLDYPCCRRAFVRGAFLTSGSMSNPGKSYHLEFVCRKMQGAEELSQILESFDVFPKIIKRKNKYIVYLKDSTSIVDVLNIMNAPKALMALENIRIIKEMKNSANRQLNCDSANINKMVKTATRQIDDINLIQRVNGLDGLSAQLKEMAMVRLAHPAESLQELGTYLDPPVGKSGVNHRLKKLSQIAEDLRLKGFE